MMFYRVDIIESERGWGSKVDSSKYFPGDQIEKAQAYVKEFNNQNTAPTAPDWYMRADGPSIMTIDDDLAKMIAESYNKNKKRKPNGSKQHSLVGRGKSASKKKKASQ